MSEEKETNILGIEFITERRKVGDLIPASYNPRQMTDKQNSDLKQSLGKFGLAELPVINKDNTIIAGHQRVRLMADAYGKDYIIEVRVPLTQLSPEDEREYNIRSNKNTGQWDWDKLANEFDITELKEWGFEDWEIGGSSDFSAEDFISEEKKKELEDKKKTCPHCGGEL